ncbi:hypothetical protein E2C01_060252 [Portunus trituberculatus]|uniref:Uncharacterized protein n=1 Tax=Portunus trituberculatus TaxID=210409 RepID=A0A5B7HAV6_PORTR|nr:hypothetical protein [Portunus trituberculatus]
MHFYTQYWNYFHTYTDGSYLADTPSVSAAIYIPSSLTLIIHHLILHLTFLRHNTNLQWVPSHVSVMGNTVANRAAAEAHTHPSHIGLATDQTDSLQYTSLGQIRQDTRHH